MDILAFWSIVALTLRVLAIILFIHIGVVQWREIKQNKTELQPLKKLLFHFVILLAITNLPIIWLHYQRIIGEVASPAVTSFATVGNAGGTLLAAVMLLLIYKFAAKDE